MDTYGYVRVSSKDQNPERQIVALNEIGIKKEKIFIDRVSGKNFERCQYKRLLKKMKVGDLLIIKSIDRLGRNYTEILEQWRYITKERKLHIQVLDIPLLNTNVSKDNLTGIFISDLVLQILAYVAETERDFIKQRQAEGIALAKAKGVKFGAKKKEIPKNFDKYYSMWVNGKISTRQAAKEMNISHTTFYRRCIEKKNDFCNNK